MVAGLNTRVNIWRMNQQEDDSVGGAMLSGSVQYSNIQARIQASPTQQLLIQQGLETSDIFTAIILRNNLDIRERDELEIAFPQEHPYYGKRFRIVGVRYSDHAPYDRRGYMMLTLNRSEIAHSEQ